MNDVTYTEASPDDAGQIVQFQIEMARETEGVELDRSTCDEGVRTVFRDPALGRYFVAFAASSSKELGAFSCTKA